jgi:hypothetical protein
MKKKDYEALLRAAADGTERTRWRAGCSTPAARGGGVRGPRHRRQGRRDLRDRRTPQPAPGAAWSRCPSRPSASARNGISSATSPHLPAAGEIVLFDRSWYNRAGVEKVMGFCNEAQVQALPEAGAGSSSSCWSTTASCCSSTGWRWTRRSRRSASPNAWRTRSSAGSCRRSTWRRARSTPSTAARAMPCSRPRTRATHPGRGGFQRPEARPPDADPRPARPPADHAVAEEAIDLPPLKGKPGKEKYAGPVKPIRSRY